MKLTTSCARAVSTESSGSGSASAAACSTRTPGSRARQASTNGSDGSTATTRSAPSTAASSEVSAPGPQPTSSALPPGFDPGGSDQRSRQLGAVAADVAVVGLGGRAEGRCPGRLAHGGSVRRGRLSGGAVR